MWNTAYKKSFLNIFKKYKRHFKNITDFQINCYSIKYQRTFLNKIIFHNIFVRQVWTSLVIVLKNNYINM